MKSKFIFNYLLLFAMVLVACRISGGSNDQVHHGGSKSFTLSGNITFTSDYCGGMQPPNTLLLQLATPSPYPNKALYIRAGDKNNLSSPILYTTVTDSLGNYSITLPVGNYCMIDDFRKDSTFMVAVYKPDKYNYLHVSDTKCLSDWFSSCFYGFSISNSDIANVNFNIHRPCFRPEGVPCISYRGPLPP